MGRPITLCVAVFTVFSLLVQSTVSTDPPEISPTPSPESGADSHSPFASPPNLKSPVHSPSPFIGLPPAPRPSDLAPGSSPPPSPVPPTSPVSSPSPTPTEASNINHNMKGDPEVAKEESSGGLSGKQKAGIALAVIVAACVVVLAGVVYKKRQDNVRRSQYGYAARREIL